jgi:hypothetical protein
MYKEDGIRYWTKYQGHRHGIDLGILLSMRKVIDNYMIQLHCNC